MHGSNSSLGDIPDGVDQRLHEQGEDKTAGSPSVLVTGSSGTIGTALTNRLLSAGYDTVGVDIVSNPWLESVDKRTIVTDLREEEAFDQLPENIDTIVHLGAHARVHDLVIEPELARENIDITYNVLEFARKNDISRLILASSREVYGNGTGVVHDEQATRVDESESPYSASKAGCEATVAAYSSCYDLSASILRFSNVYGRYDRSDRVIPLFIAQSARGDTLTVYGENKILDFTYIDDCIAGINCVIDQFPKAAGKTFNIASGSGVSLLELANKINEQTPNDSRITVDPSRNGEVEEFVADISAARQLLGYDPQYSIDDGLSETVSWYLDHPDVCEQILGPQAVVDEA